MPKKYYSGYNPSLERLKKSMTSKGGTEVRMPNISVSLSRDDLRLLEGLRGKAKRSEFIARLIREDAAKRSIEARLQRLEERLDKLEKGHD